jgi:hypothetical protein
MGLWDDPVTKKKERGLTSTQKRNIKIAVHDECETRGCHRSAHDVHHINGDKTDNSYRNLIVLCGACHDDAHGKNLKRELTPVALLRGIVSRRAEEKAKRIREILSKKPERRKSKREYHTGLGHGF